MHARSSLVLLALVVACGGGGEPPPPAPPVIVGPLQGFTNDLVPVFANSTSLYFESAAPPVGIHRVDLVTGDIELVAAGTPRHVRRAGDVLLAVVEPADQPLPQLVHTPLNGDPTTELALEEADTLAAVMLDGAIYVVESNRDSDDYDEWRFRIRRLAGETEPAATLVDDNRGYGIYTNQFFATDGALTWLGSDQNAWQIDADGIDDEKHLLWSGGDWSSFEIDGDAWDSRERVLGSLDGEFYMLRNVTSFFETGGTWSNGDPKGYDGYGGGAVYTVGRSDTTTYDAGRVVRGDVRAAVFADGSLVVQTNDSDMQVVDPRTGASESITPIPHRLDVDTPMAANADTLFYADGGPIYGLDLSPVVPEL